MFDSFIKYSYTYILYLFSCWGQSRSPKHQFIGMPNLIILPFNENTKNTMEAKIPWERFILMHRTSLIPRGRSDKC